VRDARKREGLRIVEKEFVDKHDNEEELPKGNRTRNYNKQRQWEVKDM
jgi:hypothetical protein